MYVLNEIGSLEKMACVSVRGFISRGISCDIGTKFYACLDIGYLVFLNDISIIVTRDYYLKTYIK